MKDENLYTVVGKDGNIQQIPEEMIYRNPTGLKKVWYKIREWYYIFKSTFLIQKTISFDNANVAYYLRLESGSTTWTRDVKCASPTKLFWGYIIVKRLKSKNKNKNTDYSLITLDDAHFIDYVTNVNNEEFFKKLEEEEADRPSRKEIQDEIERNYFKW